MKSHSNAKNTPPKAHAPKPAAKGDGSKEAPAGRKGAGEHKNAAPAGEQAKTTRLALIKTRHETMRKEIDQIREDLENEEEE